MLLEVYRNGEKVNVFENQLMVIESLMSNIWAKGMVKGAVKHFHVGGGKDAEHVNITFELNDSLPGKLEYKYLDVPYTCGYLNTYEIMQNVIKEG